MEFFLIKLKSVLQKDNLRFQFDNVFRFLNLFGRLLRFQMVNQPLFALKLSFALLVVYPQVLVFNLQFVVELLDFTEMFRIIFDGEGLTQHGEFILQAFVVVAKVSHLLSILLLGKLV